MVGFYDKIPPKSSGVDFEYFSFSFASYKSNSFILNENCYRIMLVLDGDIDIVYLDKKIRLSKDQLYVINPYKVYRVLSNYGQENLILYLDIKLEFMLSAYSAKIVISFDFDDANINNIEYKNIISDIKELLYLYVSKEDISIRKYNELMKNMICKLLDSFSSNLEQCDIEKTDIWFSKKLVEFTKTMFEEPQNGYSLMKLSDDFNNYSSYVSKIYKKLLGIKFVECHIFARIEKSINLLVDSEKSILEISNECGFMSSKSFYENYRKYMNETPSTFRKKMRYIISLDHKYISIMSILESDIIREIFKKFNSTNSISSTDNIVNNHNLATNYEIEIRNRGFVVGNYNKRVVNLNIFGDRWMETIEPIQKSLNFSYTTISLLFNRNMYFVYDEFSKERMDFTKFMYYIHKLEVINLKPFIILELMYENDKNGKNDSINNIEYSYKSLERFLNYISEVISVSKLKNWKFELKMPWVWLNYKNDDEYYYNKKIYNKVRTLIKNKLQNKKIGIHIGDLNLIKSDKQYEKIKKIINDEQDIDSLSFNIVDPYIYSDKSGDNCVLIREKNHMDNIMRFVNSLKVKEDCSVYISNMYLYYEWEKFSKYYWESVLALRAVNSYIEMQKNEVNILSVKYYNTSFLNRERYEKKKKEYIKKYELSNGYGIHNTCFYVEKFLSEIKGECIYSKPGVFFVKDDDEYLCLLYQDIGENIEKVSNFTDIESNNLDKKYRIRISGLNGRYKISTKSTHSESGTFYREWKNIGAPNQLSREEKEYISSKIIPSLYVEYVDIHNVYDIEVKLNLFEIKLIRITKINDFI